MAIDKAFQTVGPKWKIPRAAEVILCRTKNLFASHASSVYFFEP